MEKQKPKPEIYWIRHGFSTFNFVRERHYADRLYSYQKYGKEHLDTDLHEKGVAGCIAAQPSVNLRNFMHVFVSPMQRTIETSFHMFASHPNLGKIKFIVHPLLLGQLNNANDIPNDTLGRLKPKYAALEKYHYDFSPFDALKTPELYYIELLNSPQREELMKLIKKGPDGKYNDVDTVLTQEKVHPETKLETYANVTQRMQGFKAYLQEYIKTHVNPGEEIAIVSHSVLIVQAVATTFAPDGKGDFRFIKNCELIPWNVA